MPKRKFATHDQVWTDIREGLSAEELRALDQEEFWVTADVYLRTFGFLVRQKREALELTQMELAEYSGIQQKEISKIERGIGNPTLRTCQQLLGALSMELRVADAKK
jgi:DNA-binding XRE family transcriptional regulator